jgi:hypothetical protein
MKKFLFWKSVGGYLVAVKVRGRWCYVGSTGAEDVAFHSYMKEHRFAVERVQGMPTALTRIWNAKGSTVKALRDSLPFWKSVIERRTAND